MDTDGLTVAQEKDDRMPKKWGYSVFETINCDSWKTVKSVSESHHSNKKTQYEFRNYSPQYENSTDWISSG